MGRRLSVWLSDEARALTRRVVAYYRVRSDMFWENEGAVHVAVRVMEEERDIGTVGLGISE